MAAGGQARDEKCEISQCFTVKLREGRFGVEREGGGGVGLRAMEKKDPGTVGDAIRRRRYRLWAVHARSKIYLSETAGRLPLFVVAPSIGAGPLNWVLGDAARAALPEVLDFSTELPSGTRYDSRIPRALPEDAAARLCDVVRAELPGLAPADSLVSLGCGGRGGDAVPAASRRFFASASAGVCGGAGGTGDGCAAAGGHRCVSRMRDGQHAVGRRLFVGIFPALPPGARRGAEARMARGGAREESDFKRVSEAGACGADPCAVPCIFAGAVAGDAGAGSAVRPFVGGGFAVGIPVRKTRFH